MVHIPAFSPSEMSGNVSPTLTNASIGYTCRLIAFCKHIQGCGLPSGTWAAQTDESGSYPRLFASDKSTSIISVVYPVVEPIFRPRLRKSETASRVPGIRSA